MQIAITDDRCTTNVVMQMHYAPVGLKYQEFIVSPAIEETLT